MSIVITTNAPIPLTDHYSGGPAHIEVGGHLFRVVSVDGNSATLEPVAKRIATSQTNQAPWYRRFAKR